MTSYDVIVIGVGLAGITAALRLAESGASVLLVAKGVGATHLSPCTIDVLGYAPDPVMHPLRALPAFLSSRPAHPYHAVDLPEAIRWFKRHAPAYRGSLDTNVRLPTALGVPRPSALVPEASASGDLSRPDAIVAVGFRALKDFYPGLMAAGLRRAGFEARALELELSPGGRADVSALELARAFETPGFCERMVAELRPRLRGDERVGFPAVLGLGRSIAIWTALQEQLGRPVFEVPTLPPSVPGLRLHATLVDALRTAGVEIRLNNVVVGRECRGAHVDSLRVRVGLRDERLRSEWVVLATGGFASGGLELDSHWVAREIALGLPVSGMPGPGGMRFEPDYFANHPMSAAGVIVDDTLRPVDAAGTRLYDNVLVVGATLAGAVPWKELSGDGISLSTGHAAAGIVLGAPMQVGV